MDVAINERIDLPQMADLENVLNDRPGDVAGSTSRRIPPRPHGLGERCRVMVDLNAVVAVGFDCLQVGPDRALGTGEVFLEAQACPPDDRKKFCRHTGTRSGLHRE